MYCRFQKHGALVGRTLPVFLVVYTDLSADYQFAIDIQDESVTSKLGEGTSLRTKWFLKSEDEAPKVEGRGDTVLLRNFKVCIQIR